MLAEKQADSHCTAAQYSYSHVSAAAYTIYSVICSLADGLHVGGAIGVGDGVRVGVHGEHAGARGGGVDEGEDRLERLEVADVLHTHKGCNTQQACYVREPSDARATPGMTGINTTHSVPARLQPSG